MFELRRIEKCSYFLSKTGCRDGRRCKYLHVLPDDIVMPHVITASAPNFDPIAYLLQELDKATGNFSENMVIGKSAGCRMFKGIFEDSLDQRMIAVRVLDTMNDLPETLLEYEVFTRLQPQQITKCRGISKDFLARVDYILSANAKIGGPVDAAREILARDLLDYEYIIVDTDGDKLFQQDIQVLSSVNHPNILKLTGFCTRGRFLIYDLPVMGSLENLIHGGSEDSMSWTSRLRIAIGIAQGLNYLHDVEIPVISVDLRSSNIFLNGDLVPKVSNIFLVNAEPTGSYNWTRAANRKDAQRADIFAFGIILLELLTGIRSIDISRAEHNLIEHIQSTVKDGLGFASAADHDLRNQVAGETLQTAFGIAVLCIHERPAMRPTSRYLVYALDKLSDRNLY